MNTHHSRHIAATIVLALLFTVAGNSRAFADRALVIGINTYPNLDNRDLDGCVNDAVSVSDMLRVRGFEVTLLTDGQADREDILGKLRQMRTQCRPNERFVLFFSGHGSGPAWAFTGAAIHRPVTPSTKAVSSIRPTTRRAIMDTRAVSSLADSTGRA